MNPIPNGLNLNCTECNTSYRLVTKGRPLPDTISCVHCGAALPLPVQNHDDATDMSAHGQADASDGSLVTRHDAFDLIKVTQPGLASAAHDENSSRDTHDDLWHSMYTQEPRSLLKRDNPWDDETMLDVYSLNEPNWPDAKNDLTEMLRELASSDEQSGQGPSESLSTSNTATLSSLSDVDFSPAPSSPPTAERTQHEHNAIPAATDVVPGVEALNPVPQPKAHPTAHAISAEEEARRAALTDDELDAERAAQDARSTDSASDPRDDLHDHHEHAYSIDDGADELLTLFREHDPLESLAPSLSSVDIPLDDDACRQEFRTVALMPVSDRDPRRAFPDAQPPPPRERPLDPRLLWAMAALLLTLIGGLSMSLTPYGAFGHRSITRAAGLGGLGELPAASLERLTTRMPKVMMEDVTRQARAHIHRALGPAPNTGPGLARLIHALPPSRTDLAYDLLKRSAQLGVPEAARIALEAELMAGEGRYLSAQDKLWRALRAHKDAPEILATLATVYLADPDFNPPLSATLRNGRQLDALTPVEGDVALMATLKRVPQARFVPTQRGASNRPRNIAAAWRLCRLLKCKLVMPETRMARIELSDLNALLDDNDDHPWRRQAIVDVRDQSVWLKGIWEPTGEDISAPFPIERIATWSPWLNPSKDPALIEASAAEFVETTMTWNGPNRVLIARRLGDQPLKWLAEQLSHLIVMDYLTNAWWRFHPDEGQQGARVALVRAGLRYAHMRDAFEAGHDDEMNTRLTSVGRFSKTQITHLRLMNREMARAALFPRSTRSADDDAHVALFWERRRALLDHIDALIKAHGEDRVLFFD